MPIELQERNERITNEISEALSKAAMQADECGCVLVIMERNKGGITYFSNDSVRIETLSFLATAFLHKFHEAITQ